MNSSGILIFGTLIVLSLTAPVALIWGWKRWLSQPRSKSVSSILSLMGVIFATASAVLAGGLIVYSSFHHFPFYDPLLMKAFGSGAILSVVGLLFGLGGLWGKSVFRWYAPISSVGMLAFWILAASGE